jgi:HAD superfamily hydrolase (TIGR01549 family)
VRHEDERPIMIDPKRIRWVFFDVGDTLLDETEMLADWSRQMSQRLQSRGLDRTWQQIISARERAYAAMHPIVLRAMGELLEVPQDVWAQCWDEAAFDHTLEPPFPGTTEALQSLGRRFKLGVIANQDLGTQGRLCGHGWGDCFSLCISSTEEGVRKPDPRIFQLALGRAQCTPEQAVMVGDRIDNDIRPAKALGMATIRIMQGASRFQVPRSADETPHRTAHNIAAVAQFLLSDKSSEV